MWVLHVLINKSSIVQQCHNHFVYFMNKLNEHLLFIYWILIGLYLKKKSQEIFFCFVCRDDGRDSMKFYTDPSFFFNLWMQSMIQFPQNHHAHRSSKHERFRSPVWTKINFSIIIYPIFFYRKALNYIIKNLFMLQILHHHLNLVLFDNHRKNNNIVVLKIFFVIVENMNLLLVLIFVHNNNNNSVHQQIIVFFYNIQIIIIINIQI